MAYTGKGEGAVAAAATGKTLDNLKDVCEYHGWADRTTAGDAQLENFINQTIQLLSNLAPWPEYHRIDGMQPFNRSTATITGITGTGTTVTVTAVDNGFSVGDVGDTTSTTNYNATNKKILSAADDDTFTYTDTPSATAETSGTFTIGDQKTLPQSSIIRLGTVTRAGLLPPLDEITTEEWLHKKRYIGSTGPPTEYALRKYTSSGLFKIDMLVYPIPTTAVILYYTYQIAPTELTEDSDKTDWPSDRIWLLSEALLARLSAKEKGAPGLALQSNEFMSKVNIAFNGARASYMPIIAKPIGLTRPGKWDIKDINRFNMSVTS